MKIGIFDSGLGGLIVAKAIHKLMPEYDYVYLGDTKRVPYGNKSHESVYQFTREAVEYLFQKENCQIIIVACNTASARALRQIQQEYLPTHFPDRRVIGVLIPAAEAASIYERVGVIATTGTVASKTFPTEINKLNSKTKVFQNPAPVLVPLLEEGEIEKSLPFLKQYLKPLLAQKLNALVLGCTHYPILKKEIKKMIPSNIKIISQDEIVPKKLRMYLKKHKEIDQKLSKNKKMKLLVTSQNENMNTLVKKWFGQNMKVEIVNL